MYMIQINFRVIGYAKSMKRNKCTMISWNTYILAECINDTYGPGCINKCECYNNATCDHVSGVCLCTPGWRGRQCNKGCPVGFFGQDCQGICSCANGAVCDHVTGKCRCASGYTGER